MQPSRNLVLTALVCNVGFVGFDTFDRGVHVYSYRS